MENIEFTLKSMLCLCDEIHVKTTVKDGCAQWNAAVLPILKELGSLALLLPQSGGDGEMFSHISFLRSVGQVLCQADEQVAQLFCSYDLDAFRRACTGAMSE